MFLFWTSQLLQKNLLRRLQKQYCLWFGLTITMSIIIFQASFLICLFIIRQGIRGKNRAMSLFVIGRIRLAGRAKIYGLLLQDALQTTIFLISSMNSRKNMENFGEM